MSLDLESTQLKMNVMFIDFLCPLEINEHTSKRTQSKCEKSLARP